MKRVILALGCLCLAPAAIRAADSADGAGGPRERLEEYLRRFPDADRNQDGKLTADEAREHFRGRKSGKKALGAAKEGKGRRGPIQPDLSDFSYGPHPRNTLDLWKARADRPTPVLIFFHGGSFKAGDKSAIQDRPILAECLEAGISVVSANYRFSSDAPFPAPMHDGGRVVQQVRLNANLWNLDPARIALSGTSAGATLALWVALHDDLADPASTEPVERLSTRVACASPYSGTASLEPAYFRDRAGITQLPPALWQLFGVASQAELEAPEKRGLLREASPLRHATPDDPPLYLTYGGDPDEAPFGAETPQKSWIHHVCLGLPLKARYDELGIECELYYRSKPAAAGAEIAFLKRRLLEK